MELTDKELEEAFEKADEIVAAFDAELAEQEKKNPAMAAIKRFFMQIKPRPYSLRDMIPVGRFAEDFTKPAD